MSSEQLRKQSMPLNLKLTEMSIGLKPDGTVGMSFSGTVYGKPFCEWADPDKGITDFLLEARRNAEAEKRD